MKPRLRFPWIMWKQPTGITAAERSMTAMRCVAEDAKPEDFHVRDAQFPLLAKKNGVLERNGHTEATVDSVPPGKA